MSLSQALQDVTTWLAWSGLALGILTTIFFIFNWGGKYRLVGTTIFTLLLSASCWAFNESYRPPFNVEGAQYAPVVYDNGFDLVVAQAPQDFPEEAIEPTLQQIAGNLKGAGRNRSLVHVRIRKIQDAGVGLSKPVILGEVIRDVSKGTTSSLQKLNSFKEKQSINIEQTSEEITSKEIEL